MKQTQRKPPAGLSPKARRWWAMASEQFLFENEVEFSMLDEAAFTLTMIGRAQKEIDRDGLTTVTGAGGRKAHPAANILRDSRILFARLCRELRILAPQDDDENRLPRNR